MKTNCNKFVKLKFSSARYDIDYYEIFYLCQFNLDMSETTVAFLERLSNRTTKGINEELQKKVIYSGNITENLVKSLEKILIRSQEVTKLLDKAKVGCCFFLFFFNVMNFLVYYCGTSTEFSIANLLSVD